MRMDADDARAAWIGALPRALDWIDRHLRFFDPWARGEFDLIRVQHLGELAIMAHVYGCIDPPLATGLSPRIGDFLAAKQHDLARLPPERAGIDELALACCLKAAVGSLGRDATASARAIERLLSGKPGGDIDDERRMLLRMSLGWAGVDAHDLLQLDAQSPLVLDALPDPSGSDKSEIYRIAHHLLFATSFGTAAGRRVELADHPAIVDFVAAALTTLTIEGHLDLVGELLTCWDCLGWVRTDTYWFASALLLAQQDVDGGFASSAPRESLRRRRLSTATTEDDRKEIDFRARYHPTLVSVIAGCAHLRAAAVSSSDAPLKHRVDYLPRKGV